ncbi:MAG TPA: zinc metalloprotease [Gaiellaceae bacterium]|nr:zinc metalloprotease [Gaiellaceae bacterium]
MATPKRRQCGTMVVHEKLSEQFAGYRRNQERIEQAIRRSILTGEAMRTQRKLITIPVVVHVVYKRPAENISDAQIKSQIAVLNKDFRATNPDKSKVPPVWKSLIGDANVQFALATKDPKAKATTGITRTQTTRASFGTGNAVKKTAQGGHDAWPTDKYLNLWVCNLSDSLLGYAQFPGGPAATDGVVILYTAFGTSGVAAAPFNGGRTATHEIGHWLNLRHIWGDRNDCGGTDYCTDTPNQQLPNPGKPTFPHITCNNGPNGDMFMNYMDYVDDDTMFMFTAAQVARMNATLSGPRKKIGR